MFVAVKTILNFGQNFKTAIGGKFSKMTIESLYVYGNIIIKIYFKI